MVCLNTDRGSTAGADEERVKGYTDLNPEHPDYNYIKKLDNDNDKK